MRDEVCKCGSCRSVQVSVPAVRLACSSCGHSLGVVQDGMNGDARTLCSTCATPAMLVSLIHQLERGDLLPNPFSNSVARPLEYMLRAERMMYVPALGQEHRSAVTVMMGEYFRSLESQAASQTFLE